MADVAVIGGGPAGCAAALSLRAGGVDATVVASPRPREKPTETAVPRLRQLLQSLGAGEALAACEPCYGIQSDWSQPGPMLQPSILDPSGHAWFIHRRRFDASLARLTKAAGAVWLEAEAESVSFTEAGMTIGTTAGPLTAKGVLIATGSPAWAARVTGQKPTVVDSLVCHWSRLPVAVESRLLHVESSEHGWWYVCPGEAGTTVACFLTDAEGARQVVPSEPEQWNALFRDTRLRHQLALEAGADRIHRIPVSVASLDRRRGSRWVVAGDAAIKVDPIGSSGTATAIESGMLAAHALVASQQGNDTAGEKYDRWGSGLLAAFLRQRAPSYAAGAGRYPGGFWARRNVAAIRMASPAAKPGPPGSK